MIRKPVPDIIKLAARDLRNNMTSSEILLWNILKTDEVGVRFNRQKPIYVYTEDSGLDRFIIADFYCGSKNMIIEIDGAIHDIPEILNLDTHKEILLGKNKIKVLRLTNDEIKNNLTKVIQKIKKNILT